MPQREIGLMGYLGEAVVEQWLKLKYPAPEYRVVTQIIPSDVSNKGGGHLDFGVICNGAVIAVYEVKSQDYILDKSFPINKPLLHIWNSEGRSTFFRTLDGEKFRGSQSTTAYLILLVGPNDDGITRLGTENLRNIVLFRDIWRELGSDFDLDSIVADFRDDAKKVASILKSPRNGKRVTEEFLSRRDRT